MFQAGITNRLESHLKKFTYLTVIFTSLVLTSCATTQPSSNYEMNTLSKEIAKANQKLEELYHRVSVLQFMVDNHEKSIKDMGTPEQLAEMSQTPDAQKQATTTASKEEISKILPSETTKKPEIPVKIKPPKVLYDQAFRFFNQKSYDKAIAHFNTLVKNYPTHDLADNAIYWSGECHYTQKNYNSAVKTFKKLVKNYPDGGKVPDALLKTGYSYLSLDDVKSARIYLKQVLTRFPFSSSGTKAEEMLKRLDQQ